MQEIDNSITNETENEVSNNEQELFMNEVVRGDHQLFYLDTFLNEILKPVNDDQ